MSRPSRTSLDLAEQIAQSVAYSVFAGAYKGLPITNNRYKPQVLLTGARFAFLHNGWEWILTSAARVVYGASDRASASKIEPKYLYKYTHTHILRIGKRCCSSGQIEA